ncbi:MAG: septum formation protein Maf [Alistipes sp.]|nr:septum formation protein Maf [Alistipes sp.]MBQ5617869.1 septum formation protein Maf [Alistipes sp.]MBQ5923535.1 septum formation protein Maf [Alistipes sp.]
MLLHDKLKNYRLILASQSPRRRQLLSDAGIEFTLADRFECDETFPQDMPAEDVAEYLSRLKSDAYPEPLADGDILLTADTVVIANNRVLGKPSDRAEAIEMISLLSGCDHEVITGCTLRTATRQRSFSVRSKVHFRALDREEIEYYVDCYRPFDKAGAYGIQEWIGYVGIEGIEGSFYNVMGLPVQRLYSILKEFI